MGTKSTRSRIARPFGSKKRGSSLRFRLFGVVLWIVLFLMVALAVLVIVAMLALVPMGSICKPRAMILFFVAGPLAVGTVDSVVSTGGSSSKSADMRGSGGGDRADDIDIDMDIDGDREPPPSSTGTPRPEAGSF